MMNTADKEGLLSGKNPDRQKNRAGGGLETLQ
jgi:hypothetical protein